MMHGREKSDSAIVAGKPANKAVPTAAEPVEPRAEAEGNASQQSTRRTQSRVSVSHALERIRQNRNEKNALPSHTQGGSRMPELGPYGSVRGALSNERPYRDLRNVVANYPFESARGFPGSEPNSGHGDHSRLSCSAGDTQLGTGFCRDLQQAFCTDAGHHAASPRRHELAAISRAATLKHVACHPDRQKLRPDPCPRGDSQQQDFDLR